MTDMRDCRKVTLRFDMGNRQQREAWKALQERDQKLYKSQTAYITECILGYENINKTYDRVERRLVKVLGEMLGQGGVGIPKQIASEPDTRKPDPDDFIAWDFLGV